MSGTVAAWRSGSIPPVPSAAAPSICSTRRAPRTPSGAIWRTCPSADEIRAVLERLGLEPWDITRTQEAEAKELGLKEWARDDGSRERWITALAQHPKLIQRPIITAEDGTAVVGRTEEAVRDALGRA